MQSGVGYDLFSKGKRKIKDSEVTINFNFQRFPMKTLPVKIEGLKKYLEKMKKTATLERFKCYPKILRIVY